MAPPSVPFAVWIWAAFDPVVILLAAFLGWKADQFGKVFIAAMAAFAVGVLFAWLVTALGLPWFAPISRDAPTLLQVRFGAALLAAALGYGARRVLG